MEVTKIPKRTVTVIEPKRSFVVDKKKYEQKRVAAYCRVSTDSEEQLTSYKNQMRIYKEMIAVNPEWRFAGLYADEGISGTRADKRPQFKKMIDDCLEGKIDYIITKSVSRFARNTVDCLDYVRMLKSRGIGIFFEEQNIDTLKSDSELYLIIYAGFAQSESESISKNITWSYRKIFEEGKVIFSYSKMLGYKKGDNGHPEIVPQEAKIVENIFDMYLGGATIRQIFEAVAEDVAKVDGKKIKFSAQVVQNILLNEKYCGDAILQKSVTIDCIAKKRKKNTGEAPMYYVHNNHVAIISREKFNKVQEEMTRRKVIIPVSNKSTLTSTGRYSKFALTEVLKCAECGSRYRRVTWSKKGKKKIVWRCSNRLDYGKRYCSQAPSIEEEVLHQAIVRGIRNFNHQDEGTYLSLMKATIGEAIGINGGSDEIDMLKRRIDALNAKMLDMVTQNIKLCGDIESNEDDFRNISEEIDQLKKRIQVIQEKVNLDEDYEAKMARIRTLIDQRQTNFDKYDDSIVRQMVECIKVYHDDRIEIIFGGGYTIEERLTSNGEKTIESPMIF